MKRGKPAIFEEIAGEYRYSKHVINYYGIISGVTLVVLVGSSQV